MSGGNQNTLSDLSAGSLSLAIRDLIAHGAEGDPGGELAEARQSSLSGLDEGGSSVATDFAKLPRDEKQKAYELWSGAQLLWPTKPGRRRKRRKSWKLRRLAIKLAAKKRGWWNQWLTLWGSIGREVSFLAEAKELV